MLELYVSKFGGSSLANEVQFGKVLDIVKSDPRRKVVVVSAWGKEHPTDTKCTDLLLQYDVFQHDGSVPYNGQLAKIVGRLKRIEQAHGISLPESEYSTLYHLRGDHLVSRGEYLMGKLLARALGYVFVDASLLIYFKPDGSVDWPSTNYYCTKLARYCERGVVVPGFYGSMPDMSVRTFSRGGSDITGAILAAALRANLYENWTDVNGVLMADPRMVNSPDTISLMTYQEMFELAYLGANVLHEEAVHPVLELGIPINVRNTNNPMHPGTMIVADEKAPPILKGSITGIAARKGFTVVTVYKAGMHRDIGYACRVLSILADLDISLEHLPGGIQSLSMVIDDQDLHGKLDEVRARITSAGLADRIKIEPGFALICVVGRGMPDAPGVLARVIGAIAQESINIRVIDQGAGELTIVIGLNTTDCDRAMSAIYREEMTHRL
jgi:aspartate kinase